jgi:two-component system alkaline phosphatase synthesis response regulator PhoP
MPKKILVVDDEPDILKIVSFRLGKAGYDIITAGDGKTALDLIRKERPDLILLDLRIPVVDGYEVARQVKTDEKLKSIPIIFLTASSVSTIEKKAKDFQAADSIIKPFDPEELFRKVKKFIG